MTARYLRLPPAPELYAFRVGLGLTTLHLARHADHGPIARRPIDDAITSADGRLACDVLDTDDLRTCLYPDETETLARLRTVAGLEPGALAVDALVDVQRAVESSIDIIRRLLRPATGDASGRIASGRSAVEGVDDDRVPNAFDPLLADAGREEHRRIGA